jgi:chemotaxis protein histidine kinase CheA/CheY-like chemotaxis protein
MHAYSELHILLQSVYERMAMLLENIESFDGGILQSQLNLKRQKRLLINAQDELLQARMVPIGTVLQRFPPLLQQLVTSHHKPATLSLSGTQVLIDKAVAEKLYDPLLHLIRNAFDHGIESAELRRQAGKPETGQISVRAYHQGNRTTIEIQDDGQGLHWDRIRKRAVERQLLSLEQAQQASASQLTDLLFEPGFSTASQITQLSGRGIGLDVVRSQIQALQGSISINSVAGAGTTFLLQFPLTLTTERLLICQSKGINYALLTQSVEQILFPKADRIEVKPGQDSQQFLRWGESAQQLVPIRSLAQLMDYRYPLIGHTHQSQLSAFPLERKSSGQTDPLLLIRQRDQLLCLAVDRIMVEQELVIKSLGTRPTVPAYIQGYSVLGDGGLALVIDPLILVGQTWSTGHARLATVPIRSLAATGGDLVLLPAAQPQASAPESPGSAYVKPQQTILIVDDSITQRQAISLTLQNAGYTVLQAGDGEEALAKLQQSDQIRLVICDIEMPKMNGFEFLEAYRQHADLTSIPVVMLTSRSGQKHRQTALNLGARGYLTKPCAEQELLKTLAGFLNASLAPVG